MPDSRKKQADTLPVQDNSFNTIYTVSMCKVASHQPTECIIWAGSSFTREIPYSKNCFYSQNGFERSPHIKETLNYFQMCHLQCPNLQANKRPFLGPPHNQRTSQKTVS